MGHYKSNLRDLEFNLFELFALDKTLASGQFGDLDVETVRDMLGEVRRLAEGPLADEWLSIAQAFAGPPGGGRKPGQFTGGAA